MDRELVPGKDRRQSNLLRFWIGPATCLSVPCGAIRELDRAAGGYLLSAAGPRRTGDGFHTARSCRQHADPDRAGGEQSIYADRLRPTDRAVGEERDPDRRGGARSTAARQ